MKPEYCSWCGQKLGDYYIALTMSTFIDSIEEEQTLFFCSSWCSKQSIKEKHRLEDNIPWELQRR